MRSPWDLGCVRTTERKLSLFSVLMDAFQGGQQIKAQSEEEKKKKQEKEKTSRPHGMGNARWCLTEGKPRAEDWGGEGGDVRLHGI